MRQGKLIFAGMLLAIAVTNPAAAGNIVVNNYSFETLPNGGLPFGCGLGCSYSFDQIPGWSETGSPQIGQFNPGVWAGNFTYFNSVPDGQIVAYSNGMGDTISQSVSALSAAGGTYTLTVDIGFRNDGISDGGTIELQIGNQTAFASLLSGPLGSWVPLTVQLTALTSGQPITIDLINPGGRGTFQADFDDVVLSVPEPGSLALLGGGILAFGSFAGLRRRKQTQASPETCT
jgi:hypothetical protein